MKMDHHGGWRLVVLALLRGRYIRQLAALLIVILLGAIFSVYVHHEFFFNNADGGWEYSVLCSSSDR